MTTPMALMMLIFASCAVAEPLKRPRPDLLFLENAKAKVGIDRSMGAAITWLSWQTHPTNAVNIHDPGRLIQQSYYAGKVIDRRADGQHEAWSPWSWNPIQGGGVHSWARVKRFEKLEDRMLISVTVPKLWDMPDEEAAAKMIQKTEFEPGMKNVIRVHNRLICQRSSGDRWGPAVPRKQELPAMYFTSAFRHIETYLGNEQWQHEHQPAGPPWGKARPPLKAMACFNDAGQGIAIFSPVSGTHWNFGPHLEFMPDAKPADGPCVHLAPLAIVRLAPTSTLEYSYWLIVGDRKEITYHIDALLKTYSEEKLLLTHSSDKP